MESSGKAKSVFRILKTIFLKNINRKKFSCKENSNIDQHTEAIDK